jgi:hypothetical protein
MAARAGGRLANVGSNVRWWPAAVAFFVLGGAYALTALPIDTRRTAVRAILPSIVSLVTVVVLVARAINAI